MPRKHSLALNLPSQHLLWMSLLLLIGSIIAVTAFTNSGGLASAYQLATSHNIESYTQLYFNKPASLPAYAATGKTQTVPFTIANHTGKTQTYRYETIFQTGGQSTMAINSVSLAASQATTLSTQFVIPTPLTPGQLTILLLGTNQRLTLASTS